MNADIVETSDPEEQEELRAPLRGAGQKFNDPDPDRSWLGESPPRKRVKLDIEASHAVLEQQAFPLHSITSPKESQSTRRSTSQSRSPLFVHDDSQDPLLLVSSDPLFPPSSRPRSVSSCSPTYSDSGPSPKYKDERLVVPTKSSPLSIPTSLGSSPELRRFLSEAHDFATRGQSPSTTPPFYSRAGSPLTPRSSSPLSAMQPLFTPQASVSGVEVTYSSSRRSEQMDIRDQGVQLNDPEEFSTSRYSLRRRQPVQIAPYSVDKFQYKQALRHNPEAIIRVRSPERNRQGPLDRYEDDGTQNESQDAGNTAHGGSPINQLQSESRNPGPELENVSYPEILQSSSETDEDNESKAISKEAQIVYKARIARETRQKKKEAVASRKTRPFPVTDATEDMLAEDTGDLTNSTDRYDDLDRNNSYAASASLASDLQSPRFGDEDREMERDTERDAASASEAENSDDSYDVQSKASGPSSRSVIDKRKLRMLGYMMPQSMVKQMLYQENSTGRPKHRRQRSEALSSESGENLPPGRSKIRTTVNVSPTRQIRGDSESSGDAGRSDGTLDSDLEIITHSPNPFGQHQIQEDHEVLSISDSGSETEHSLVESSDGDVADEDIRVYLQEEDTGSDSMENDNLINRMLTRTSVIRKSSDARTSSRKLMAGNKRPKKGKYMTDVITHGARKHGKGRQQLLDFDRHDRDQSRCDGNGFRPRAPRLQRANHRHTPSTPRTAGQPAARGRQNWKAEHRQARQNKNGVYTFSNQDRTRIVSSRNEGHPTVFHTELEAPGACFLHDWANAFRPSDSRNSKLAKSNIANPDFTSTERREEIVPIETSNALVYDGTKSRRQKVVVDMGIHMLPSGISFSPDTFIGKGWLHELIGALSTNASPSEPTSCHLCGYVLRSDMGCETFLNKLQSICEDLLEFSTGLPEVEHTEERSEWNVIIRTTCQLVSWYHTAGDDDQRQQLIQKIEICAQNIVNRIRDLNFESKSLDIAILQLDWFIVELLARAHSTSHTRSTIFHETLLLLIGHLIELDAYSAFAAVTPGNNLDSSTVPQRSAELWVCLLHLLGNYQNGEKCQRGNISFWSLLLAGLRAREQHSILEASEMVWRAIFSLCALSQFSVHGMTTSQPRLSESWAVVLFALKKVRLAANPVMDQKLPTAHLTKRDKYIRILLFRCFQLCDKWQWQLEDASELFNELGEVFRSRKFSNLRYERPDYPYFMLHRDWSCLRQHEEEDSAFMLFLKLVVRAIKAGQGAITPPKFKKLLSLAIPVGSLPFSKEVPPSKHELPMLFNRLSAIAIGVYLDPSSYRTRISHARTYVAFANADVTTRVAVMRGMVNLAILMKKIDLPLDATTEWITEIASTFSAELKKIPLLNRGGTRTENEGRNSQLTPQDGLHLCIQILLLSVRCILDYHDDREYPDPALIWSIKDLLVNPRESKTICEIRKLIEVLHKARSAALHSPEFQLVHNDNVENGASEDKEKNLCNAIEKTHLVWFCWRNLAKDIQGLKDQALTIRRAKALDQWIYCWLGCIDILVRNGDTRWSSFLYLPKNLDIKNDVIRRRVDFGVAKHLLQLYPMIYTTYTDMFLEVFFESLAVDEPTIEHEYVSLLLSVDGLQHPLLRELTSFHELNQPRCNISSTEFSTLRLPVLKVVLTSLNNALERQNGAESDQDIQRYIDYCIKCFSTMRSVFSRLERGSGTHTTYLKWCKQIFASLQGLGHILSHQKMADLVHWGRSLEMFS